MTDRRPFRILPVLDLLGGVVVRGVAGRRDEYRPVVSRWTSSAEPLDVAQAIRAQFGLSELYIADLDAILGRPAQESTISRLVEEGFRLLVDAGVQDAADGRRVQRLGANAVVAGLETLRGPRELAELCRRLGPQNVVFSLDLNQGAPLGAAGAWGSDVPEDIAREAIAAGVRRMILLDLAQVGMGNGLSTVELGRQLRRSHPNLELITGGGVRGTEDLRAMRASGFDAALIATALHNGAVTRCDLGEPTL